MPASEDVEHPTKDLRSTPADSYSTKMTQTAKSLCLLSGQSWTARARTSDVRSVDGKTGNNRFCSVCWVPSKCTGCGALPWNIRWRCSIAIHLTRLSGDGSLVIYDQCPRHVFYQGPSLSDLSLPPTQPTDRKSTRLNSSHSGESRMPSSA